MLVDKPYGWTSFRAVKLVRRLTKAKKVGHAGTLDPLATGLLIICTGKFTKRISEFQDMPKVYSGSFRIGEITPSFDLETEVTSSGDWKSISADQIMSAVDSLTGEQMQTPPVFSAVKIDGVRAYKKARQGDAPVLEPKKIFIYHFEITGINGSDIHFLIKCSKGTYIRSIARDLGEKLGCGAHLTNLRRESIGDFRVSEAYTPETLNQLLGNSPDLYSPGVSEA
ncbi:MAG: tRNA pseudouridine(55) synthase TruB [Bacteroidetes bacterium]|nr:tRNA pseudouridine(55) synthase TruB [Bacteroidota bacterium]